MSVHEFYPLKALITLEQVNSTEWSKKKKIRILISKIAMIQLTWEIQIPLLIYVPPPGKHVSLVICVPPPGKHVSLVICVPPPGKHVSLVTCAPPPGKLYRKHISLVMCQGHPTRI